MSLDNSLNNLLVHREKKIKIHILRNKYEAYEIDCMSPKPVVQRTQKPNALNAVADDKTIKTRIKKY